MRSCILLSITLLALASLPVLAGESTTVIVVRHAEKQPGDLADPDLTAAGHQRARALLQALNGATVDAIFATQYRRTQATVAPLAEHFGLETTIAHAESGEIEQHAADLADRIHNHHAGQMVVVAGHSNTVPEIIRQLGRFEVRPIGEDEYDHLFILTISPDQPAQLIQSRYGSAEH